MNPYPCGVRFSEMKTPPLLIALQEPVRAMCAVCLAATGGKPVTVGQAEEAFALAVHLAGVRLNDPVAPRHLLNWFDDTPRAQMRPGLPWVRSVQRDPEARPARRRSSAPRSPSWRSP